MHRAPPSLFVTWSPNWRKRHRDRTIAWERNRISFLRFAKQKNWKVVERPEGLILFVSNDIRLEARWCYRQGVARFTGVEPARKAHDPIQWAVLCEAYDRRCRWLFRTGNLPWLKKQPWSIVDINAPDLPW